MIDAVAPPLDGGDWAELDVGDCIGGILRKESDIAGEAPRRLRCGQLITLLAVSKMVRERGVLVQLDLVVQKLRIWPAGQ